MEGFTQDASMIHVLISRFYRVLNKRFRCALLDKYIRMRYSSQLNVRLKMDLRKTYTYHCRLTSLNL